MNNKFKVIAMLLAISFSAGAKNTSGIYLSPSDYKNDKLTYPNECGKGERIHIHDFFWSMPTITVKAADKKYTFKKNEVYGYKNCKNETYRFYNNTEYRIAQAGNIYIYVQEKNIAQSKGYKVVNTYYFSTTADGAIYPLTTGSLKNAYKDNDKFCELLDLYFTNTDTDANAYDKQHSTFKINYLYSKTISSNGQ